MKEGPQNTNQTEDARIRREAAEWTARQDLGLSPEEQDAFFDWLAADPRHSEAFSARKGFWNNLNVLAEWRPEHSLEPNPDLLAVNPRKKIIRWAAAITALAAVFLVGLFIQSPWTDEPLSESTMLASGDGAQFYEHHLLEDGSTVELNRGAQVSVHYLEDKRLVKLMAGEAHFTVARDEGRPFVVHARETVVEALGTAFNVSLNSEELEVLVTDGRVLMSPAPASPTTEIDEIDESAAQELSAGQRSLLSLQEEDALPLVEEFSSEQIARRLAWKNEVLNFTATPLSEVVLEFNRRNHTQMVIADPALAAREITATLRPNNLEGFLELIEITLQVKIRYERDDKIVLFGAE